MAQGKTVGIASIGYGRKDKAAHSGTGHDLTKLTASIIGDEVLMMAERLPEIFFAVAHTKTEAAKTLEEKYHPDIILVDDGFQHQSLHREVDLLLIDATLDLRREPLFPLGRRREPLKAIRRADLIILTRASQDSKVSIGWMKERYQMPIIPVTFENSKIIDEQGLIPLEKLQNCPVYIFAGIGNFAAFKRGLESRLRNIRYFRQFHDHCRYDEPQRALIKKDVGQFSPEFVITTHKDYVKLRGFDFGRPVYYLDMEVSFQPNRDVFYKFIGETLLRKYGKKI
jgi:tetraacyldisaccharide 4'-kinase